MTHIFKQIKLQGINSQVHNVNALTAEYTPFHHITVYLGVVVVGNVKRYFKT
jgi:hypothetical protein